jgi:hypothetical protein
MSVHLTDFHINSFKKLIHFCGMHNELLLQRNFPSLTTILFTPHTVSCCLCSVFHTVLGALAIFVSFFF